ncbi:DNA repair protein RecO [Xanthomonadaceae bacterium XH05]|nr:DNA repair protein RecO [Xanthomonadaceae bacterium XH05]
MDLQPAYVLHARAYRETSLLLDVFTRDHGRVGLIARGVRGPRGQATRAALQPFQPQMLSWRGQGELFQLTTTDTAGIALGLRGDALLSGFYLNEVLLRLLPRHDPHAVLFWRYAECLNALAAGAPPAWELRRFERDLLDALGYALALSGDSGEGEPLDVSARYHFDPESGPRRIDGERAVPGSISGAALIALRDDAMPDAATLRELRRLMRGVLLHHLGGRELRSWQVLGDLAATRRDQGA